MRERSKVLWLGGPPSPQDLQENVQLGFLNLPTLHWPRALVYFDLHAENAQVRGDDAIIVDLARVTMGPPSAYAVCMEVWIAFEFPPPDVAVNGLSWLTEVKQLCALPHINAPEAPEEPSRVSWLRHSILQIRRLALARSSRTDFAITLALCLLRRAMFEPDRQAPEQNFERRTWAWILRCRVLEAVWAAESCYEEPA